MIITLTGYRGCGKSTVGPLVAAMLGWDCVDSDQIVEEQAGCSIRQIFESEGEVGFRLRESQALKQVLSGSELVLSAGGGAILSEDNRTMMRAAGPVVWLQASAVTLAQRIAADASSAQRRPSLTDLPLAEEVARVLSEREPLYRAAATMIADSERFNPEQLAEWICQQIRNKKVSGTFCGQ